MKAKKLLKRAEQHDLDLRGSRSGPVMEQLIDLGLDIKIDDLEMSMTDAGKILGVTVAAVSRAMRERDLRLEKQIAENEWTMDPVFAAMLPVDQIDALRLHEYDVHDEAQQQELEGIAACFWEWEHEFVTIGSNQDSFIVELFHRTILLEILTAFIWGRQVLVLTPPRHGKSELILRFVGWIILMYPNIQILWVAANTDLAGGMTTKLKGIFEHSKKLREAFLPPGKRFGDKGCKVWQENAFTLYTRTDHTLTSPTFVGLGSTSTVAGRNADFIGIDDLEERKTVGTADLRAKGREKHSEIMERKELHTGVVTIASRQHPDDIPNHLMDQEGADAWKVLTFPAHDEEGCVEDPEVMEAHIDCMLMPSIRPYSWLLSRQTENEALGLPGRYPLRYLQKAVPVEGVVFDIPLIKDLCLDRSRGLGMGELPAMYLLAGLDPAPRGMQVGFLWGWDGSTLHMIDFIEEQAGGVMGAVKVMGLWGEEYELRDWIHEDNSGQIDAWKFVDAYKQVVRLHSLNVKSHTTGNNKHDPESGVSSMAGWYHKGKISLPYGTPEARRKTNRLLRQLELWTTDGFSKKGKTDIKMAHWLPFPRIQKMDATTNKKKLRLTSQQSYPSVGREMNSAPWQTLYPGGQ